MLLPIVLSQSINTFELLSRQYWKMLFVLNLESCKSTYISHTSQTPHLMLIHVQTSRIVPNAFRLHSYSTNIIYLIESRFYLMMDNCFIKSTTNRKSVPNHCPLRKPSKTRMKQNLTKIYNTQNQPKMSSSYTIQNTNHSKHQWKLTIPWISPVKCSQSSSG